MVLNWISMLNSSLYFVPFGLGKLSLMKYVQKLFGFRGIQVESISPYKLQCVPLGRIVTCSDSDTTLSLEPRDCQLQTWRRTNAEINNLTTCGEQTRHHCRAHHRTRGTGITTNKNA